MKKIFTLLLALCLIVSVCALPVSAASISFNSSNIEITNAAQGILKVSGILTNDTHKENRYITVLALPSGTPITGYADNTLAISIAIVDLEGNFSTTFAFNQPAGTYDFYALYEGQTFGPAVYTFKDLASVAAVVRDIANGTIAKDSIVLAIQNHGQTGIDFDRFPIGFERNLFVYRMDANRSELTGATDAQLVESFYALADKAEGEAAFVKQFNNTTYAPEFITLMKANATYMKGISYTAYNALGYEGKIYVQNSFIEKTFNNADEIKVAFDLAVANAPQGGGNDGGGSVGGSGGGGSTQEPEEIKTKITVENETCRAGETISVPVIIENNTGLAGLTIECTYDSVFSLIAIENGTALSNLELTVSGDLTANPVKLLWDGMEADNSNGKIAILTFKVANNAEIGNYNISLTVKTACDQDLQDVSIDTVDGIISVIDYIPGDVNEDKTVNVKDVIMARRYIAGGYGVNILEDAADVNADDVLTVKDIILLRKFVVGGYGAVLK